MRWGGGGGGGGGHVVRMGEETSACNNLMCKSETKKHLEELDLDGDNLKIPYILESNPQPFCSFRGRKKSDAD